MKEEIYWTESKIQLLKTSFLQGKKIKQISGTLERSPSAISKALHRFGIRPLRKKTSYIEWSLKDIPYRKKPLFLTSKKKRVKPFQEKQRIKKPQQKNEDDNWVSLQKIADYLINQGLNIKLASEPLQSEHFVGAKYFLNQKPVTALQLLLVANKIRLEERKPIFLVDGVSW